MLVYTTRYLELLKRCITREIFIDEAVEDVLWWPEGGFFGSPEVTWKLLHEAGRRIVRPFTDYERHRAGVAWPMHAETMVGTVRLENVHELVRRTLQDEIPGDLVETGVWRGGVIILMRALLEEYGDADRLVWACDSFEGLPQSNPEKYPDDVGHQLDEIARKQISVPLEQVKRNIKRYGLLDDRIRFLEGWFRDTLPNAPIRKISVLRLDGDLYESTMDALVHLEPKVMPGGYIIVDDYLSWKPCRLAVTRYRQDHGINDKINKIDWTGIWWRKSLNGSS